MTAIILLSLFAVEAQAPRFVSALAVASASVRQTALNGCPPGFQRASDQDLNEGAGGEYVFLCAKYTDDIEKAITHVMVHDGKADACPSWMIMDRHDLNQGAGGRALFVCYGRQAGAAPIIALDAHVFARPPVAPIDVICWDPSKYTAGISDADNLPADVNRGAGGKYIYLCSRRASTRKND